MRRIVLLVSALTTTTASSALAADDRAHEADPGQLPYATPRETLIPGTPGMPGGFHLMLNFEPFSVGPAGIPEVGESGEGLWDAQHSHQLFHQAMIAVHPLASMDEWHPKGMMSEGRFDLSLFGGQGSATIGPPIFMHRASSPGPTVPRSTTKEKIRTRPSPCSAPRFASTRLGSKRPRSARRS